MKPHRKQTHAWTRRDTSIAYTQPLYLEEEDVYVIGPRVIPIDHRDPETGSGSMESLHNLLVDSLADVWSAERQIARVWPLLAQSTSREELRQSLELWFSSASGTLARLSRVFSRLGFRPTDGKSRAIDTLLRESESLVRTYGTSPSGDAAILGAAHKIKNHLIACYSSLRSFAWLLGNHEAALVFDELLDEAYAAYSSLNKEMEDMIHNRTIPQRVICGTPPPTHFAPPQNTQTQTTNSSHENTYSNLHYDRLRLHHTRRAGCS